MAKKKINRAILVLISLLLCAFIVLGMSTSIVKVFAAESANGEDVLYLSDTSRITHNASKSKSLGDTRLFMAPGSVDKIPNKTMQAKIEGSWYTFTYGIYAHGPSCVVFDISNFSNEYRYFSAYAGLLSAAQKSDGAFFCVQTSEDGENWTVAQASDTSVPVISERQSVKYNQNFLRFTLDVTDVKWIKLVADQNSKDENGKDIKGSNAQDYVVWADAKLTKALGGGEDVTPVTAYDASIKEKMKNVDWSTIGSDKNTDLFQDKDLELLVLRREFVSRVGQYALKRFKSESEDNRIMLEWLIKDLDTLREFMLGGAPFKGNYYNSLTVLSGLYRRYKADLNDATLLRNGKLGEAGQGNKFMPTRTFGELCRTMMFSVALTHDGSVGSYLQGSITENKSDPYRRYAIFKYMYQTERFVATRNADGSWKSETMNMFGSLRVEEMRWLMCSIIDDESLIWLNDYVQTRINASPNSVGNLYTPHSYVRYTDPNYNNPVFYSADNYDYFNGLFSVDSREVKVGDEVIIPDDNAGTKLEDEELIKLSKHPVTSIAHYGLWDAKYTVPAGEGEEPYTISVSRTSAETAKLQKVWMNFNNKFKTGSVCGGISKSGVNIRTSRGIPANVIGQPGHAAILYYSQDANGNGSWKIDNDVGGWLAATKGERHLLGWGNASWQRNSGGTVVYFHLSQACLNDYDNLVRAEEYTWLAKVYQGDLAKQEALYEKAITTQLLNLDAWYGLTMTYMANKDKTADNFVDLAARIGDTYFNHPIAMHCLFRLFSVKTDVAEVNDVLASPLFTTQLKTIEINALARTKASGSTAAKSKVNYLLANVDLSVADFSFDGENAGCIVWADAYNDGTFTWKYSLDGKKTWTEVTFNEGDSHAYKLSDSELSVISPENDIYVYIVGTQQSNAYKIDVAAKPALPNTLYANDWENRVIGVDATYEWRYCKGEEVKTETGTEIKYTPLSNWRCYADASPDCSGDKVIEVRLKGTSKNPASEGRIFKFTADTDPPERKYISVNYLSMDKFSTESQDPKRPNYAVNAIDGNGNTYWHTQYEINIKLSKNLKTGETVPEVAPYLTVKVDVPRYISGVEFAQRQYNAAFSIFAKKVTVYVSETGEDGSWKVAAMREDLEEIDDLKAIHFNESIYAQYVKLEMTELYKNNTNDGVFTTVSLFNIYEDTTKTTSPYGETMKSLTEIAPSKDAFADFGEIITEEEVAGEELVADEEFVFENVFATAEKASLWWIALIVVPVVLIGGGACAFFFIMRNRKVSVATSEESTAKPKATKASTAKPKATKATTATAPKASTATPKASTTTPKASTATAPKASTPAPKASTPAPKASTPAPKASTPAPKASTPAPKASTPAPKASTPTPKASTATAPKASTPAPKASTATPKASTTTAPKASTATAPKASTPAPKASTPAPKASTATAPKASTPAPKASTPAPKASTPTAPKASTPAPKASTPAPKASTATPKASTTAPKASTTKPKSK